MFLLKKPTKYDIIALSLFAVLITLHPHYMHGKINLFEVGLYLPGIQGVLNGQIPYRDFFHLRGPFELYIPALMMRAFGEHLTTLYSYFYFGNVLCFVFVILIAAELIKSRFVLYLFTPVLIARTFPRVAFTFWGGMRYAFGLIALWCAVKFLKNNKAGWLVASGISSVMALFISIEMGVYCFTGVMIALVVLWVFKVMPPGRVAQALGAYSLGASLIGLPYLIYLATNGALMPYIDSTLSVVMNMQTVIDPHLGSTYPRNFAEAIVAMTNPNHTNFKHMTPSYLYIFILIYLFIRWKKGKFSVEESVIVCIASYGFIMYNTGFRGIWTSHFEMALQIEKTLMFFLLELFFFYLLAKRRELLQLGTNLEKKRLLLKRAKLGGIYFLLVGFFMSSIGYSIARYNHRFVAYKIVRDSLAGKDINKLKPLANEEAEVIEAVERVKGILAPLDQAQEIRQVASYVNNHISPGQAVLTYPELGAYNFFFDRPAFGGFPIVTFAWFNDAWHQRFMDELNEEKPLHIIMEKDLPDYWEKIYLSQEPNRKKYDDVMSFVKAHYDLQQETALSYIYRLK